MDFGLSEEQQLLEQTVRRFLAESVPIARVREIVASPTGHDPGVWKELAGLGIAGVLVPEEHGGAGLGLLDAALAMQSLAWGAAPAPFLSTGVMAPAALRESGTPAQQAEWLPRLASGESCAGVALTELVARRDDAGVRVADGRLHGTALFALDAGAADVFLVAAGPDSLALVPRDAEGLNVTPLATVDRTRRVAELGFERVAPADWIGGPGGAATGAAAALDAGRVAVAADLLGACDRALEMAVAYAGTREQFGRPIGSFQAVKHLCAEMAAEVEPARALVWYAAHAFAAFPEQRTLTAAHAKAHLAEVGTFVVRTATEVHGGIGFTEEHDLHLWFKRAGLDRQLLGTPALCREAAARASGGIGVQ